MGGLLPHAHCPGQTRQGDPPIPATSRGENTLTHPPRGSSLAQASKHSQVAGRSHVTCCHHEVS